MSDQDQISNISFYTSEEHFFNLKIYPKFNLSKMTTYTGIFVYKLKKYGGITFIKNMQ
jgi:hypothetical protein